MPPKSNTKKKDVKEAKVRAKVYPMVTSATCEVCKTQCPTGIAYMTRMRVGGAKGTGVSCRKA